MAEGNSRRYEVAAAALFDTTVERTGLGDAGVTSEKERLPFFEAGVAAEPDR